MGMGQNERGASRGSRRSRCAAALPAKAGVLALLVLAAAVPAWGRPPHRQSLKRYYGAFLSRPLDACTTCHIRKEEAPDGALFEKKPPHNPFGARLKEVGRQLRQAGKAADIAARLQAVADEDSDADGVPNELEILAGRRPGDPRDTPSAEELKGAEARRTELRRLLESYPWEPFRPVERPSVPPVKNASWVRNPIDSFIAKEHQERGLSPRPEPARPVLLRRVYLDLIGLPPRPEELHAFIEDRSSDAYEKVVDRLLASARYGERWGRHWMDVWRYSDWAGWGNQVRDSQPHVWRWRDWIVESLNADKGYDRMVTEMLAADELSPGDPSALRATGYLVRNFKLLSREAWMQETVDHATKAFLGVTVGCARCHDHMFDPISQKEYYQVRAIFEPYQVRLDRVPGQADTQKDGLARVFDADLAVPTFLFVRGDERNPVKDQPIPAGVPEALGGPDFRPEPVALPFSATVPEKQDFVERETVAAGERAIVDTRAAFEAAMRNALLSEKAAAAAGPGEGDGPRKARQALEAARGELENVEMAVGLAEGRQAALLATLAVERLEDSGAREKDPEGWKRAATAAAAAQRWVALLEARLGRSTQELAVARARAASEGAGMAEGAQKDAPKAAALKKANLEKVKTAEAKLAESEKALEKAKETFLAPATADYTRRPLKSYPAQSTGRRLAFARWITGRKNPLAARVAVNHIWLRHFGQPIVPSVFDFGQNGRPASHPALLDWLAAELMEPSLSPGAGRWSMKPLHRLIVTSAAYRMASTPDPADLGIDPDNRWLWRMNSRRLEAEAVRDEVLHVAGQLDLTMGGPELGQELALSTCRRSIYYRHAAEKQPEFLQVFDMALPAECYERKVSVVPQQALALLNSSLVIGQSRRLAERLLEKVGPDPLAFAAAAFEEVLARAPAREELQACAGFLRDEEGQAGKREKLVSAAGTASEGGKPAARPASGAALRAREGLVHALMNHNDFVTVR
jgi:hypothetical protein